MQELVSEDGEPMLYWSTIEEKRKRKLYDSTCSKFSDLQKVKQW